MATQDSNILTKKQIKQLAELSNKLQEKKLLDVLEYSDEVDEPGETFKWNKGGILPEPDDTVYGPPKQSNWNISTDDFMSEINKKAIEEFMKENFPGLKLEEIIELCKEKYPENYV